MCSTNIHEHELHYDVGRIALASRSTLNIDIRHLQVRVFNGRQERSRRGHHCRETLQRSSPSSAGATAWHVPAGNRTSASMVEGEHSSKELFGTSTWARDSTFHTMKHPVYRKPWQNLPSVGISLVVCYSTERKDDRERWVGGGGRDYPFRKQSLTSGHSGEERETARDKREGGGDWQGCALQLRQEGMGSDRTVLLLLRQEEMMDW